MKRAKISAALVTALTGLAVVACGPANNAASDVAQTTNRAGNTVNRAARNVTPAPVDRRVRVETKVAQQIDAVKGVDGASVMLANKMAYVGIGLHQHVSDAQMRSIKNQVVSITKKAEPSVSHVYVSADPGALHQMQTFAGELGSGHPVSGTWNRFQSMTERIWPHHG